MVWVDMRQDMVDCCRRRQGRAVTRCLRGTATGAVEGGDGGGEREEAVRRTNPAQSVFNS